ncbi:hypothetical protein B296_00008804 [Ensete ventricosum]|uniref:Uncharacterized protein n=1 Tax=Ensete ventricosum TaxID=4639 RepID=A0A426ZR00_ENSVE|nr:hypothetical protein B296_00008804 [Ensete ventricosum]
MGGRGTDGFGLADEPGDGLGCLGEDGGGVDAVEAHVGGEVKARHSPLLRFRRLLRFSLGLTCRDWGEYKVPTIPGVRDEKVDAWRYQNRRYYGANTAFDAIVIQNSQNDYLDN